MRETSKGSILVVDDTPVNRTVLTHILPHYGYQVQTAEYGEVALQAVQQALPDLILLDVMMPKMNRYGTCQHLR
jgi:OmpR family response regulator RpaB